MPYAGYQDSPAMQRFQLLQRARPVGPQQTREAAIGEHFATGLTSRAVIRFVIRVPNAQHRLAANRTRKLVTPMHRHFGTERSDLFGELLRGFLAKALHPASKRLMRGVVE